MRTSRFVCLAALIAFASTGLAQQSPEQTPPLPLTSPANSQQTPSSAAAAADPQGLKEMARTVTEMAEMCQMMMKNEKAAMPYFSAAGITLGTLIFAVLVLLVVLEVQWIIYWGRLLKYQKRKEEVNT